jgi:hypothetical protein
MEGGGSNSIDGSSVERVSNNVKQVKFAPTDNSPTGRTENFNI